MATMPGTPSGASCGLLLLPALAYAVALLAARRRHRPWPAGRTVCWYAGLTTIAATLLGPAAASGFVAHMGCHLLLGMVAPLLLVLAAPGTLALRALPARHARRLSRFLGARPVRALVHPMTAAALDGGSLWLLYTTPLYPAMMDSPSVHLLVQAHVLLAGTLFAYAVAGSDPMRHRPGRPVRAAALLAFLAAHAILAKFLYGHPPTGVPDSRAGAELMYYGGDAADLALVTIFCWQWYDPARFRITARRPPQPWRLESGSPPVHAGAEVSALDHAATCERQLRQ
jgi:putative membrane protein